MSIPTELKPLIAQVRQQYPQLKDAPDEVVARIIYIMQAIVAQQKTSISQNPDDEHVEKMSAQKCLILGERLLNTGKWEVAERVFLTALVKGEKSNRVVAQ